MTNTTTNMRANKVTITTNGNGWVATFARTHKDVGHFTSEQINWESKGYANKTAEREAFRTEATQRASEFGITWQPEDLRTQDNLRPNRYDTEADVMSDAVTMISKDIKEIVAKTPWASMVEIKGIVADMVAPVLKTAKGFDLEKMGVLDGRYIKTNAWAWATIPMTITMVTGEQEIYLTTEMQLVSGQMKKPKITQTGIAEEIKKNLLELGLIIEEAKAE